MDLMSERFTRFKVWSASDEGATAVEYGILVALIAVAVMASVGLLGTNLNNMFTNVAGKLH
jgi:pilus assembly protein Flp/PilA